MGKNNNGNLGCYHKVIYEDFNTKTRVTVCFLFIFEQHFYLKPLFFPISFSLLDIKFQKNLEGLNWNTVFAIFAVIGRILEPGATVKILSLVLGFGFFSAVMVIAVVLHLLCYEERKSNHRSVLYRHKKSANVDYSSVWKLELRFLGWAQLQTV